MIGSFKHRGLKRLYERGDESRIQPQLLNKVSRILGHLDTASVVESLDLPGYRLHPLRGTYKGFYAVDVSGNWRIIFKFDNGLATDIDLVDYH